MKRFVRFGFILGSLWVGPVYAQTYFPVEDLKPGMKGTGLTVLKGWEPVSFQVEIVDVVPEAFPQGDMVLARLSGQNLEELGVSAGMSGSPVYIDSKLLGAVAYTWGFAKEPIVGIVPADQMWEEASRPYFPRLTTEAPTGTQSIASVMAASGAYRLVQDELKDLLSTGTSQMHFLQSGGSVGGELAAPASFLKPGDAVAVHYVTGDLELSSVGTLTDVKDGKFVMFGHPAQYMGELRLPVSRAYVQTVMPSYSLSFKMASGSEPIGSTRYSGLYGVFGESGFATVMTPVRVRILGPDVFKDFHFQVAPVPTLSPDLTALSAFAALSSVVGSLREKDITMDMVVKARLHSKPFFLTNRQRFVLYPRYFYPSDIQDGIGNYLSQLQQNHVADFDLENIQIKFSLSSARGFESVDALRLERRTYRAGETVYVHANLRRFQKGSRRQTLQFKLPRYLKSGEYMVLVANEADRDAYLQALAPEYYLPETPTQLLRFLNRNPSVTNLTASILVPETGIMVGESAVLGWPRTLMESLKPTLDYTLAPQRAIGSSVAMRLPVFGAQTASIYVDAADPSSQLR